MLAFKEFVTENYTPSVTHHDERGSISQRAIKARLKKAGHKMTGGGRYAHATTLKKGHDIKKYVGDVKHNQSFTTFSGEKVHKYWSKSAGSVWHTPKTGRVAIYSS